MNEAPSISGAPRACSTRRPPRALLAAVVAVALAAPPAGASASEPVAGPAAHLAAEVLPVASPFEEAFDRFVPVFPATTARYFGFTDLGPRPGDAISAPSEVERYAVLAPAAPAAGLGALAGQWAPPTRSATATPHPLLRVTGGGPLSRAWSAPGSAFASTGWLATLAPPSGGWRGKVSATLGEEVRGTSAAPASSRVGSQTTASLQLRPIDALSLQAEGHRISERGGPADGVVVTGARAGAVLALRPRLLELTLGAGVDRVEADTETVATGRSSATAGITAHLGPALTLSGSAAVQTGVLTPAAANGALFGQLQASRLATAAVAWRASPRLLLSAATSWVATPLGVEAARQLRGAWSAGPAGPLGLALGYEESVDPGSGTRSSQVVLQPSLRLGRYASLEASVRQAVRAVAGPAAHPLAVFLSFGIRS